MASHVLLTCLIACAAFTNAAAQDCPHNIDFETGTFDGWTCYTGFVAGTNGQNIISLSATGPESNRHTMYTANSGGQTDPYGDFPVNCPNGSGHSIRLGNDQGGGQAEGISYEFVIPANKDVYSLIYHYAVVFQDPDHLEFQQPRMEIEITNVTDNIRIDCSSFTFHPYGSVLPGFELSANPGSSTAVWYKNWSAVSINLDGQAGKTIRLFFKTADCTFRRHFGYAYIDVNSECSGEFVGATYCHDDTAINVVAPYGYQTYTWYDKDFTTVLGSTQTLTLRPPPLAGTTIAVTLVPYDGYGCLDTLYARLVDTLTLTANAGADMLSCNLTPVQIGAPPKPGLIYNWSPGTFLSSPTIANPVVKPDITTTYIITTNNSGGGCRTTDTVLVKASVIDNTMRLTGKAAYCVDSEDSAVLSVRPTSSIQWFKDDIPINGANQPTYKVLEPGNYSALLVDVVGCSMTTSKQPVVIEIPRPGITYPVKYAVVNLPLTLQARSFGKTVQWQPANYLDKSTVFTPVFKGPSEQFYTIGITSAAGCLTVDSQLVKTINGVGIYVPTGFTPNNDKKNDFLRPLLYGVKEVHYFKVFNRLGQLLYQSKDDFPGWNGMFNGVQQTSQAVVWVLEVVGVDGIVYLKKGTSVLVR
jgi:gliding motility-associated-like protein